MIRFPLCRTASILLALSCVCRQDGGGTAEAGTRTFQGANFTASLPAFQDGDTFSDCNFRQPTAHTAIGGTAKALAFVRCNLTNCDVPASATLKQCLVVHMRTTVVETVSLADFASYQADLLAASDSATKAHAALTLTAAIGPTAVTKVGDATAALANKQAIMIDAAQATAAANRTAAKKWVPKAGAACKPVLDANGVITSYSYTVQEIVP